MGLELLTICYNVFHDLFDHGVNQDADAASSWHARVFFVVLTIPEARRLVVEEVVLVRKSPHIFLRYLSELQVTLVGHKRRLAAHRRVLSQLLYPSFRPFKALLVGNIK